jgi:hypothetical protein
VRRYSEISQDPADFGYPFASQNRSDAFEVGVDKLNTAFKYRQSLSGPIKRFQIPVYPNHSRVGRGSEDCLRMSSESHSTIDKRSTFAGPQPCDDLRE